MLVDIGTGKIGFGWTVCPMDTLPEQSRPTIKSKGALLLFLGSHFAQAVSRAGQTFFLGSYFTQAVSRAGETLFLGSYFAQTA